LRRRGTLREEHDHPTTSCYRRKVDPSKRALTCSNTSPRKIDGRAAGRRRKARPTSGPRGRQSPARPSTEGTWPKTPPAGRADRVLRRLKRPARGPRRADRGRDSPRRTARRLVHPRRQPGRHARPADTSKGGEDLALVGDTDPTTPRHRPQRGGREAIRPVVAAVIPGGTRPFRLPARRSSELIAGKTR